jgi:predicted GIY-YIG superfamily endonuclease
VSESNALSKRSASKGTLHDRFFVYIVKCADGSLYVGFTTDVDQRMTAHNEGIGAAWTACRRPVQLVYFETFDDETSAIRRERQLKRWTIKKKLALIAGDTERLRQLSKRHQP